MKCFGLSAVVAIVFAGLVQVGVSQQALDRPAADQNKIDRWIELLDHDDFQQREEASRKLIEAGETAISAVAKAAASDSQEVAWRSGVILQQIGISGNEAVMAKVVRAMAKLEKSGKRSFKQSGAEILQRWREHRDQRAVAMVRRLGGEVADSASEAMAGLGGFGGAIPAPAIMGEPVIVDFDDLRFEIVKEKKEAKPFKVLKDLDGLKVKIAEEADSEKPIGPIKPLSIPKLPKRGLTPEDAKVDTPPSTDKPADGRKNVEKLDELNVEEVERFVEELKRGKDSKPRAVKVASDRDKQLQEGGQDQESEPDLEDVIDLFDADELAVEVPKVGGPAIPVFGGGFAAGGVVAWDVGASSQRSRMVRLGKDWKGSSADLRLLREVSGLSTLELVDFNLDSEAIKQIAGLKRLQRLHVQHSKFEREQLLALKRANPELSIYATGKTLLGVSGQPHADGFSVTQVVSDSAASSGGLMVGDVIVEAGGIKLTNVDELTIAIAHKEVGDPLPVTFKRGDKLHHVVVKLGPRPTVR